MNKAFKTVVITALLPMMTALLGVGRAAADPAGPSSSQCAPVVAILTPGTWETHVGADPTKPVGMLAPIGQSLKKDYGSSVDVFYPAYSASAFDKGLTYAQSESSGIAAINQILQRCNGSQVLLSGYSQGADAAGDVASAIGNGRGVIPASNVKAVALLSDPKRGNNSQSVGPKLNGQGILGARAGGFGSLAGIVKQICDPTDLYCNTNQVKDNFLSSVGKIVGGAGIAGANQAGANPNSMVSNYSNADFQGAPSTADMLKEQTSQLNSSTVTSAGGAGQLSNISSLATQVLNTFAPVLNTQQFVQSTKGVQQALQSAPAGSAEQQANSLLGMFGKMNVAGIVQSASSIVQQIGGVLGGSPASTPAPAAATPDAPAPQAAPVTTTDSAPSTSSSDATPTTTDSDVAGTTDSTTPSDTGSDTSAPTDSSTESTDTAGASTTPAQAPTSVDMPDTVQPQDPATAGMAPVGAAPVGAAPVGAATTATGGAGTTTSTPSPTSNLNLASLSSAADNISTMVSPMMANSGNPQLATAASVLGVLKPSMIVNTGLQTVQTVFGTDYVGIVNNLLALPQEIFRGDIPAAHKTAGELNNQFSPWIKLAAQLPYSTAGQLVSLIPDPSGTTAIVSLVLNLVQNVDIIRLAKDVGQIQEVAWNVIQSGNLLALANLVPIGLDLASVAVGVFSPTTKMSPDELNSSGLTPQLQTAAAGGTDLASSVNAMTSLASSQGAADLAKLIGQGMDAASFYASGAHTHYADFMVGAGQTAIQFITNFFRQCIQSV